MEGKGGRHCCLTQHIQLCTPVYMLSLVLHPFYACCDFHPAGPLLLLLITQLAPAADTKLATLVNALLLVSCRSLAGHA